MRVGYRLIAGRELNQYCVDARQRTAPGCVCRVFAKRSVRVRFAGARSMRQFLRLCGYTVGRQTDSWTKRNKSPNIPPPSQLSATDVKHL